MGKRKRPKEGRLTTSALPARVSTTSKWSEETRRLATGRDPELVFTSISLDRDSSRDLELTSLGLAQCQISWFHPTSGTVYLVSDPGWRGGGCQPLLVPSLSPTLFPEEDPAVADQCLEAETMTVKGDGRRPPASCSPS